AFYRYDLIDNRADDTELALRVNVGRRWESGSAKWIFKSGVKSRMREADQDQDKDRYLPGSPVFSLTEVSKTGPATIFKDIYALGPSWDVSLMDAFFRDNPGSFAPDEANSILDSLASDFSVSEGIHSTYAMAQRENDKWVVVAGMRLEHTEMESQGYETISEKDENGNPVVEIRPVSVSQDYNKLFPGLHVLHRLNRNWVVRASLTRTLQRPDFRDLSPSSRVNLDTKRIRSGNPELRPFDAKALDLGTDFLLNNWGAVSLGFFAKRIDDFIVDIEEQTDYLGEPGFTRSYPVNGSPAELVGIEAAWNTTLTFLPGLLDTTNLSLNYTWTDSTAAYPGHPGTIIMLPEQVRDVFNASLRWQYANWTLSLRTRYHGLRLNDLIIPGQDQFNEGFWSHSVSVAYKINNTMSFSMGFANLNHPDRITYQGHPGQLVANREGSRSFSIGLNIRFGQGKIPPSATDSSKSREEG
ncbi:MAG TPA: TonB-dependent receptor, partial [Oceanipulchritudo sp.]|nr:TonB-dependent receptor [Oceanipulchritudo sp.]